MVKTSKKRLLESLQEQEQFEAVKAIVKSFFINTIPQDLDSGRILTQQEVETLLVTKQIENLFKEVKVLKTFADKEK